MELHAYDNTKTSLDNYNEMIADSTWVASLYVLPASPAADYPDQHDHAGRYTDFPQELSRLQSFLG